MLKSVGTGDTGVVVDVHEADDVRRLLRAVDQEPRADRPVRRRHRQLPAWSRPRSARAPPSSCSPSRCRAPRSSWRRSLSNLLLLAGAVTAGAVVCWAGHVALFGEAPVGPLARRDAAVVRLRGARRVRHGAALGAHRRAGRAPPGRASRSTRSRRAIGRRAVGRGVQPGERSSERPPRSWRDIRSCRSPRSSSALLLCVGVAGGAVWAFEEREL